MILMMNWGNLPLARLSSVEATVTNSETYVNVDDQVVTTDNLTNNEIIESVLQTQEKEDEDKEENCNLNEIPTTRDALYAITMLKKSIGSVKAIKRTEDCQSRLIQHCLPEVLQTLRIRGLMLHYDNERNDDDAERSLLVASEKAMATSTPLPSSPQRSHQDSMSGSPQKEHFQGCLKLYAENKINKDNAWNLQLIDFMTSMLRRHDARMENLQTASTVVDASARIYSFRVDAVHYDVLKMAGGLSKAAQTKRGKKDDEEGAQEDGPQDGEVAPTKKKRKKTKGAIATNPEIFNGDFDTNDFIARKTRRRARSPTRDWTHFVNALCSRTLRLARGVRPSLSKAQDPFFERLAATAGDVTSSNRAFNATLPIHDTTLGLILRTNDKFLEYIPENLTEELQLTEHISLPVKLLPSFQPSDQICEPFAGFSISNWNPETEDCDRVNQWVEENRLNLSQQALAFDVNADIEPIPQDEVHNDLLDDEPLAGIESEEEADVAVAACVARVPAAPLARLTDMRPAGAADSRLEYSYSGAIVAAWAGPAHWRLKNNRGKLKFLASKLSERTQSTNGVIGRLTADGKKGRTKKQLDFTGAGLAINAKDAPAAEYETAVPAKIMISRKTLATGHTWNEANFKTPIDRGLDQTHFYKLFLRRNVTLSPRTVNGAGQPTASHDAPPAEPLQLPETHDYDYDNENDASYCPNSQGGEEWGNEEAAAAGDLHDQMKTADDELGDMLEPPTKIAKIFIPYAMRAKKIDMKQLKHCTWRMLTEKTPPGDKEHVSPTTFATIYRRLPGKLSTTMRDSLSVPLALLSVLHLANEKGLILERDGNVTATEYTNNDENEISVDEIMKYGKLSELPASRSRANLTFKLWGHIRSSGLALIRLQHLRQKPSSEGDMIHMTLNSSVSLKMLTGD
ncbi:Condensin complex subunit 2 [Eumeta japonica]|uniref:Condensin complex subunit 2 n=1 Tax=Eumeta variegata TaxID=151549 RepID=A0A4C1X434_EUMVA|nr:Condensin complex subunit 2 [Eumeta japonica]